MPAMPNPVVLVTVADEGAGHMILAGLALAGIAVEAQRVRPDNPYQPAVMAAQWNILVPTERLADAQQVIARLERELAEEVDAQAKF